MRDNKAPTHYDQIKNSNKILIRNQIREAKICSKAELSASTGLSFPTISQAVSELKETGEIVELCGKSKGGRPGNEYCLNSEYEQLVCAAFLENEFVIKVFDYCGELLEESTVPFTNDFGVKELIEALRKIRDRYHRLKHCAIGIPGIIVDGEIVHYPYQPRLERQNLKEIIHKELGMQIFLENDINAIAMGETSHWNSFAHIIWIQDCIGSAIVVDGKLIRGAHGCAGEVEYVCHNLKSRLESLKDSLMAISAVIDVPVIAISGNGITEAEILQLSEHLSRVYDSFRIPEVVYVTNEKELYFQGLWRILFNHIQKCI